MKLFKICRLLAITLITSMVIGVAFPAMAGETVSGPAPAPGQTDTAPANPNACTIFDYEGDSTTRKCVDTDLTDGAIKGKGAGDIIGVRAGSADAFAPIDVFGKCRYVDAAPDNATDVFVPFNSEQEWTAFRHAAGEDGHLDTATIANNVKLVPCALPVAGDVTAMPAIPPGTEGMSLPGVNIMLPPELECGAAADGSLPSSKKPSGSLPYARVGTQLSLERLSFTCTVKGACDPLDATNCSPDKTWTQYATPTYTALNSDELRVLGKPSWKLSSISYSGVPAAPGDPPVDGVCGSADNTTVSAAPTTNLCSRGTASAVTGSGPWNWSCAGTNGGDADFCSADKLPTFTPVSGLGCASCPFGSQRVFYKPNFTTYCHLNAPDCVKNLSVTICKLSPIAKGRNVFANDNMYEGEYFANWGPGPRGIPADNSDSKDFWIHYVAGENRGPICRIDGRLPYSPVPGLVTRRDLRWEIRAAGSPTTTWKVNTHDVPQPPVGTWVNCDRELVASTPALQSTVNNWWRYDSDVRSVRNTVVQGGYFANEHLYKLGDTLTQAGTVQLDSSYYRNYSNLLGKTCSNPGRIISNLGNIPPSILTLDGGVYGWNPPIDWAPYSSLACSVTGRSYIFKPYTWKPYQGTLICE